MKRTDATAHSWAVGDFEARPRSVPMASSVRIEGFCREPERLLRTASVHIFPSTCEGSAKVTFEAAAAGLPQITTHESGESAAPKTNPDSY